MTTTTIYLDEAGDTGWSLHLPYLQGGSSRFLVLGAIVVPPGQHHHLKRIPNGLYKHRNRSRKSELKSVSLNDAARNQVAQQLVSLVGKNPAFSLHAIVAEKANVNAALQRRSESFYAHMAEQMLHNVVSQHPYIDFIPDARTLKETDRHTLHSYLETRLAIAGHMPLITTTPSESKNHLELQATDYLCSIVFNHFEWNNSGAFNALNPQLQLTKLF